MTEPRDDPEVTALEAGTAEDNPFFASALRQAALAHLADGKVSLARATGEDGRLLALAPIRPTRLGHLIPAVAAWVHPLGPLGTPLLDREDPDAAAGALIAAMDGARPGRRILAFPYLPLTGPVAEALKRQARIEGRPTNVLGAHPRALLLRASDNAPDRLPPLAPKKRKELARQFRRLAELGTVTLDHVTQPQDVAAALDDFFALEASGWKGRRGTALTLRPAERAFAVAAVTKAAATGDAALHAIRLDGRAIAMLVSFRAGATAVTWKIAYDEAYARFSPGVHLMLEASRALMADPAITRIDSLAIADHPMVDHLWPDRLEIGTLVIGPKGGGFALALGLALARLELAARPILRNGIRRARKDVAAMRARLSRSASAGSPEG
ncbi:GNAT family N-acetyltransferase [Kaistia granuli]|uniref:GNAT family N-acetyltransferase n=1 Tax=Kaistia granuli TaxID=363259 RepID=UPI00037A142F|nr:GNAT family N-acetyltransferase [Kaistia granuli]